MKSVSIFYDKSVQTEQVSYQHYASVFLFNKNRNYYWYLNSFVIFS